MYLCYLDESGTPQIPGTTSHYILAGIAIPVWHWRDCDNEIRDVKYPFSLVDAEIHTGWILRDYREQAGIPNFEKLDFRERKREVDRVRKEKLFQAQRVGGVKLKQLKKYFAQTESYVHLTSRERRDFMFQIARKISSWGFSRLFAECIDKIHFDPTRVNANVDEQAFEQVVSRFQTYLSNITAAEGARKNFGLLIHDNNPTAEADLTNLMRRFHGKGTAWTNIDSIIETPLFVDSRLTGMVQIADFCAYALRRYLENQEDELFDLVFQRADRILGKAVGVRHFTKATCQCKICQAHR